MRDEVPAEDLHLPIVAVTVIEDVAHIVTAPGRDGGPEFFPLRRAGKNEAVRFAVGEPGRRGTVWRLWASRDTDDVYLASRKSAGEMKISLHQSGDWRIQMVEPERPKTVVTRSLGDGFGGRVLFRWPRPDSNAIGWTRALSLVLPAHHLVDIPGDNVRWDDVRWYPSPGPGDQVTFEIYVVTPQLGVMSYQELLLAGGAAGVMDALQLASGPVVVVIAIRSTIAAEEAADLRRAENLAFAERPAEEIFDRSPELAPRMMLFGSEADGRPRIYDFAYEPAGGAFRRESGS